MNKCGPLFFNEYSRWGYVYENLINKNFKKYSDNQDLACVSGEGKLQ